MARYTGPSWKLSRRLGISLSGTGKECILIVFYAVPDRGDLVRKGVFLILYLYR
jgi:hypothetical protein